MCQILKGCSWAAAFLFVAVGNASGLIADDSARTMFIVLPLLAWLSISGSGNCLAQARGAAK
jgi:hypothetical protein